MSIIQWTVQWHSDSITLLHLQTSPGLYLHSHHGNTGEAMPPHGWNKSPPKVYADCPSTYISPVCMILSMFSGVFVIQCVHLHRLQVCVSVCVCVCTCSSRKRTLVQMVCWCLDRICHANAATLANHKLPIIHQSSFTNMFSWEKLERKKTNKGTAETCN